MTAETPYNANPELVAMKQDIADRKFHVKVKGMMIGAALLLVGAIAAAALMTVAPQTLPHFAGAGRLIFYGATAIGGTIVSIATMKELKKLEMDEQYIQSYMQGKNYWGEGYRQEVAEKGFGGPQIPFQSGPPPLAKSPQGRANG